MPINSGDSPSDIHIFSGSMKISGSDPPLTVTGGSIHAPGGALMLGGSVYDANGNEILGLTSAGSAVNYVDIGNSATGGGNHATVTIEAKGDDSHVNTKIEAKGTQAAVFIGNSDGSGRGTLFLNSADDSRQCGISAPANGLSETYHIMFPVRSTGGTGTHGHVNPELSGGMAMRVTSRTAGQGWTYLQTDWAKMHGAYEPTGYKFYYGGLTSVYLKPTGSLDGVARIPCYSGSVVHLAEVTGTLTFDFALGPGIGAGGIQNGATEQTSQGVEIRYISGSSGQALLGTPETGSLLLPSGYTYASDILWFIYQGDGSIEDGGPAIMNFQDTGRTCWYGAFGPGSMHDSPGADESSYGNADQNFLVNSAANDEWTEFSYDSQVPKNAKKVHLGFYYEGTGASIWALSLSGTFEDAMNRGNMLLRMGSNDTNANASEAFWLTSTQPALTGTLMYRFQRYDGAQTGYMWCMGYSF